MKSNNVRTIAFVGSLLIHALVLLFFYIHSMDISPITSYFDISQPNDSCEILFKGDYILAQDVINNNFEEAITQPNEQQEQPKETSPENNNITPPADNDILYNNAASAPSQLPNNQSTSSDPITNSSNVIEPQIATNQKSGNTTDSINNTQRTGSGSNVGDYNVPGYAMAHWEKPQKTFGKSGNITISITVSKSGMVLSAIVKNMPEEFQNDSEIKTACEDAARKCSFIPNSNYNKPTQKGTIIYKIE